MKANLKTHAGVVLPYHVDGNRDLHFVFERKDPGFKIPFFDNGLNFLGGNYQKGGKYTDASPEDTAVREIREEFGILEEDIDESYEKLTGQSFESWQRTQQTSENLRLDITKRFGNILSNDLKYVGADFIASIHSPLVKTDFQYAIAVFLRSLSQEEFGFISSNIADLEGRVTTDNLKWGSRTEVIPYSRINQTPEKFSWGYDQIMNYLIERSLLPLASGSLPVIRPLSRSFLEVNPMEYSSDIERTAKGVPTFRGFEQEGYNYILAA